MIIGIYTNTKRDIQGKISMRFMSMLREHNVQYVVCDTINEFYCGETVTLENMVQIADIMVVFGGDGTVLNVARQACMCAKPVLGINSGYLGFLTEVDNSELESSVDALINHKFSIESRSMLQVEWGGNIQYAINEVSLARWNIQQTIDVKLEVDDKFADIIIGDGVIVCTPTGSTAYSLSCGGAILSPTVKAFEITAISPHSLHTRPIVISEDSVVNLTAISNKGGKLALMVDGTVLTINSNCLTAKIKRADCKALFIRFNEKNFFPTLMEKLGNWNKNKRGEEMVCQEETDS